MRMMQNSALNVDHHLKKMIIIQKEDIVIEEMMDTLLEVNASDFPMEV